MINNLRVHPALGSLRAGEIKICAALCVTVLLYYRPAKYNPVILSPENEAKWADELLGDPSKTVILVSHNRNEDFLRRFDKVVAL